MHRPTTTNFNIHFQTTPQLSWHFYLFRLTAAVDWKLYQFIDDMYSADNIKGNKVMTPTMIKSKFVLFCYWNKFKKPIILAKLDMTEYNLDINTTNFIMETAHQKEDLVDK